jgi:hypothetical protein
MPAWEIFRWRKRAAEAEERVAALEKEGRRLLEAWDERERPKGQAWRKVRNSLERLRRLLEPGTEAG